MLTIGKGCSGPMKTAFVWLTIYGWHVVPILKDDRSSFIIFSSNENFMKCSFITFYANKWNLKNTVIRPEHLLLSIFSVYQNLWRGDHCFICDIIKSKNTQIPVFFHIICLGNFTFHETLRNKRLIYSYQEKNTIKKYEFTYKKVQHRQFLIHILSNENVLLFFRINF